MNSKRIHLYLLIAILILAFVLRMGWPTLSEFKRDEATVARLAQAIAYEGYWPAIGVDSSVGIDNLPLTLYLMAIPIRLWPDPLSAVLFTSFLNSLAVLACYTVGKLMFNRKIALIATGLFAINPWAILYARKIWCRTLPLFTLIFMGCLFVALVQGRKHLLIGAFISLAALLGLQLEGLAFIPIFGLALILYHKQVDYKSFLIGAGVCGLLLAPYGIHDALHGWKNLRDLFSYTQSGGSLSLDAVRYALMLTGSAGIEGQAGAYHRQFQESVLNLWGLNELMMGLTVIATGYGLYQAVRGKTLNTRRTFTLLSLWFWIPIALQLRSNEGTQIHYFVTQYPVQFLLIAAFVSATMERLPQIHFKFSQWKLPVVELTLALMLLIWGSWQSTVALQRLRFMAIHPSTGGYGIPLRYSRTAARTAQKLAQGNEVIVLSYDTHPFKAETPTVFDALLFKTPHRFSDIRWSLPIAEHGNTVYLTAPLNAPPPAPMMYQHLSTLTRIQPGPTITLPDGVRFYTYAPLKDARNELLRGLDVWPTGVLFANKVVFAAHQMPETITAGQTLTVWLAWWLQGPPPQAQDYHFTLQLLDEAGALQGQHDHAGFPSQYWQTGDLVLYYFMIPIPDSLPNGTYHIRAGMYTYPDITSVPVIDAQGHPLDTSVTLGTIAISE